MVCWCSQVLSPLTLHTHPQATNVLPVFVRGACHLQNCHAVSLSISFLSFSLSPLSLHHAVPPLSLLSLRRKSSFCVLPLSLSLLLTLLLLPSFCHLYSTALSLYIECITVVFSHISIFWEEVTLKSVHPLEELRAVSHQEHACSFCVNESLVSFLIGAQ